MQQIDTVPKTKEAFEQLLSRTLSRENKERLFELFSLNTEGTGVELISRDGASAKLNVTQVNRQKIKLELIVNSSPQEILVDFESQGWDQQLLSSIQSLDSTEAGRSAVEKLRCALSESADDAFRFASAFRDTTHGSQVISSLPAIANALFQKQLNGKAATVRGFVGTADQGVVNMLCGYLDKNAATRYSKLGEIHKAILEVLSTSNVAEADQRLQEITLDDNSPAEARQIALKGLREKRSDRYAETVDSLFTLIAAKDDAQGASSAYNAAEVLIGNHSGLTDRIIEQLRSVRETNLIRALGKSEEPKAKGAIYEIGLSKTDNCAELALKELVEQVQSSRKLSNEQESALVNYARKFDKSQVPEKVASALVFASTKNGIQTLIDMKALSELASLANEELSKTSSNTDIDNSKLLLLQELDAGMVLLTCTYRTSYYGPPSRWIPIESAIRQEVANRVTGARLLAKQNDWEPGEKVERVLNALWQFGVEHEIAVDQYSSTSRTRKAAAEAILAILKSAQLTYDEDTMRKLERFARPWQR